jgi:hypothetical protein
MPHRPPREWFARCTSEVARADGGVDPAAVCGAVWARKTTVQKAATTALEEGRRVMKRKLRGAALKDHERAKRAKKRHAGKSAHRSHGHAPAKRGHAHHKKDHRVQHRCGYCGHTARHEGKHGCLHIDAKGRFCPCRHRG